MAIKLSTIRNLAIIGVLLLACGAIGYHLGQNDVKTSWTNYHPTFSITSKEPPTTTDVDFSLFWTVWDKVSQDYVDKKKLDSHNMTYGAIEGMVAAIGDPYTLFLPPDQNKASKESLNGNFEGIGAQLGSKDNHTVVIAPLDGTPAQRAGILAGDWIIKVNNEITAAMSLQNVVDKIRGPKGSTVVLNILHDGQTKPVDISIVRDTIQIKSVVWNTVNATLSSQIAGNPNATISGGLTQILGQGSNKATYIKLSSFGEDTDSEWNQAVSEITASVAKDPSIKGLIVDVRNNPGGYLNDAVYIASEFMKSGLIVQQANGDGTSQDYNVNRAGHLLNIPLVVLINKGSASASEILAGALQSTKRAILVGEQSFGKGSVQEAEDLPGGAGLHVTISKWLLPNGNWIMGQGLTPDVKIVNDDKNLSRDLQLEKAIDVVTSAKVQEK